MVIPAEQIPSYLLIGILIGVFVAGCVLLQLDKKHSKQDDN